MAAPLILAPVIVETAPGWAPALADLALVVSAAATGAAIGIGVTALRDTSTRQIDLSNLPPLPNPQNLRPPRFDDSGLFRLALVAGGLTWVVQKNQSGRLHLAVQRAPSEQTAADPMALTLEQQRRVQQRLLAQQICNENPDLTNEECEDQAAQELLRSASYYSTQSDPVPLESAVDAVSDRNPQIQQVVRNVSLACDITADEIEEFLRKLSDDNFQTLVDLHKLCTNPADWVLLLKFAMGKTHVTPTNDEQRMQSLKVLLKYFDKVKDLSYFLKSLCQAANDRMMARLELVGILGEIPEVEIVSINSSERFGSELVLTDITIRVRDGANWVLMRVLVRISPQDVYNASSEQQFWQQQLDYTRQTSNQRLLIIFVHPIINVKNGNAQGRMAIFKQHNMNAILGDELIDSDDPRALLLEESFVPSPTTSSP